MRSATPQMIPTFRSQVFFNYSTPTSQKVSRLHSQSKWNESRFSPVFPKDFPYSLKAKHLHPSPELFSIPALAQDKITFDQRIKQKIRDKLKGSASVDKVEPTERNSRQPVQKTPRESRTQIMRRVYLKFINQEVNPAPNSNLRSLLTISSGQTVQFYECPLPVTQTCPRPTSTQKVKRAPKKVTIKQKQQHQHVLENRLARSSQRKTIRPSTSCQTRQLGKGSQTARTQLRNTSSLVVKSKMSRRGARPDTTDMSTFLDDLKPWGDG